MVFLGRIFIEESRQDLLTGFESSLTEWRGKICHRPILPHGWGKMGLFDDQKKNSLPDNQGLGESIQM